MIERAKHQRDKRLRAKMLMALYMASRTAPTGRIGARLLKDMVEGIAGAGDGFEGDDHALGLMRDLRGAALAEEKQITRRVGQGFGLDFCEYGITAEGVALHTQASKQHPLVWDDRIEPEND